MHRVETIYPNGKPVVFMSDNLNDIEKAFTMEVIKHDFNAINAMELLKVVDEFHCKDGTRIKKII